MKQCRENAMYIVLHLLATENRNCNTTNGRSSSSDCSNANPMIDDANEMGEAVGPKTIDLQCVHLCATGLVKPDDFNFFAASMLHGVGSFVDARGNRVANELGEARIRDRVVWKNTLPVRCALNKAASDDIARHCNIASITRDTES